MEASVGAHPLVQQRFCLNSKLHAPAQSCLNSSDGRQLLKPEEVGGGSSGVALLGVEEEPVAVFKLLLRDVPDRLFI